MDRYFFQRLRIFLTLSALAVAVTLPQGCSIDENFPSLGLGLSGPIDAAASSDGQYFYVLNSDFAREYDAGSILVLKEDGTKVKALTAPRMGRSITISQNRMLVTYDRLEIGGDALVELYDVTNPEDPVRQQRWDVDCPPVNAAMRDGYSHFAVSCSGGRLFIGTFAADLTQSSLKEVRSYGRTRRALYIDPERELLFAFVTDLGPQTTSDFKANDALTYTDAGAQAEGPNEVPDEYEDSRKDRLNMGLRHIYQFVVYDIKAEREAGFPMRELNDAKDPTAQTELRWLYFTLNNIDGTPDSDEAIRDINKKNYRTNIWAARPNPLDPGSFYMSHRGHLNSENANNIVKVSITGDLRVKQAGEGGVCETSYTNVKGVCVPVTADALEFERVYGFGGEIDALHYPSDFEIKIVKGEPLLVVNHFRDLVYWKTADRRFSMVAKVLGQSFWLSELKSDSHATSFYQVALNERGRALTCSFYGNSVLLLDVNPGTDIKVVEQIF